jgi:hypothetical protein
MVTSWPERSSPAPFQDSPSEWLPPTTSRNRSILLIPREQLFGESVHSHHLLFGEQSEYFTERRPASGGAILVRLVTQGSVDFFRNLSG